MYLNVTNLESCHVDLREVNEPWTVMGMRMGMPTMVKTTCARVILMALTGDGSMSTNCCSELRVCRVQTDGQGRVSGGKKFGEEC